jgi:superfamily II DNA helicase RecQ
VAAAVDLASGEGQWIVWCGLNDEANAVTKAVEGAVNVEGSMTPDEKADAFEAFQDGRIRVLVTKPSIAGMGMNFQQCHRMVFVGISDSWESYYQAIRRCYRFGQQREVEAHIVVSDLEMQIVENVRRKETEVAAWIDRLIAANAFNKENAA